MLIDTTELAGEALNYAVAVKLGHLPLIAPPQYGNPHRVFVPLPNVNESRRFDLADAALAWQLMVQHRAGVIWRPNTPEQEPAGWKAGLWSHTEPHVALGRAILGPGEWAIPEELLP